jgi:hypothetical protein
MCAYGCICGRRLWRAECSQRISPQQRRTLATVVTDLLPNPRRSSWQWLIGMSRVAPTQCHKPIFKFYTKSLAATGISSPETSDQRMQLAVTYQPDEQGQPAGWCHQWLLPITADSQCLSKMWSSLQWSMHYYVQLCGAVLKFFKKFAGIGSLSHRRAERSAFRKHGCKVGYLSCPNGLQLDTNNGQGKQTEPFIRGKVAEAVSRAAAFTNKSNTSCLK